MRVRVGLIRGGKGGRLGIRESIMKGVTKEGEDAKPEDN